MIIRKAEQEVKTVQGFHDGHGTMHHLALLGDYDKTAAGFKFIHDNLLEPGAHIGEHTHEGDEEVYIVVEGHGTMTVDGKEEEITAGDICLTRSGHSHSFTNSMDSTMRMIVIGVNI